jgi:hypothetical protein
MIRLNSSIFSSERAHIFDSLRVGVFVVIGLMMIDLFINVIFAYPRDPKITDPSHLKLYFEYGRSSEGKLARMTRADPSKTAPITLAGWYDPLQITEPSVSASQKSIITFYGMSHAVRLGQAVERISNRYTARSVAAPGATTNWSYGAYLRDRGGGKSRAVVLAFMSVSLPMITSMSPMTWDIDFPMPYTADRFYIQGGNLTAVNPPFSSFEEYSRTFNEPTKWSAAREFLARHDAMYNALIMRANVFDHSSLFRLLRRAYAQRYIRDERRKVLDETGFHPESEQVQIAQTIIHEFAKNARSDGIIPIIYLVNNFGYSDYLYEALRPALEVDGIPYLSSHTIISPNDPRGYLPDSHFTDAVDDRLAKALTDLIDRQ